MGSTTKFGWPYPDPSDLVRDAPEAFEDLADAIETTLGGTILQVVSTTKTDTFTSTSSTFADITGLSANITPRGTASKVWVFASMGVANTATDRVYVRLMRGATAIAVGNADGSRPQITTGHAPEAASNTTQFEQLTAAVLDSPNTTSSTTYSVQIRRGQTGTMYVNRSHSDSNNDFGGRGVATLTLMEVAG